MNLKAAVMGCGQISGTYLKNLMGPLSKWIKVMVCSDLIRERAENRAKEFGVPHVMEPEDVYIDDTIDLIICLTDAPAHHYVCKKALENGKHAYTEKTFGIDLTQAGELIELARKKGLYVGGAPDTFLGAGLQTCRQLISDGWIGKPISAVASLRRCMTDIPPAWLWQPGAGPLLDMGPYYLTALISILGKVDMVAGQHHIPPEPRGGIGQDGTLSMCRVEVPTHVTGLLRFSCGVDALIITSLDVWDGDGENRLEINGTDGTLIFPDPNCFGGPVKFFGKGMTAPMEIPLLFDFSENSRGVGAAEMARAILLGEKSRVDGALGYHVLETAERIVESGSSQAYLRVESDITPPEGMPRNFASELCTDSSLK